MLAVPVKVDACCWQASVSAEQWWAARVLAVFTSPRSRSHGSCRIVPQGLVVRFGLGLDALCKIKSNQIKSNQVLSVRDRLWAGSCLCAGRGRGRRDGGGTAGRWDGGMAGQWDDRAAGRRDNGMTGRRDGGTVGRRGNRKTAGRWDGATVGCQCSGTAGRNGGRLWSGGGGNVLRNTAGGGWAVEWVRLTWVSVAG